MHYFLEVLKADATLKLKVMHMLLSMEILVLNQETYMLVCVSVAAIIKFTVPDNVTR